MHIILKQKRNERKITKFAHLLFFPNILQQQNFAVDQVEMILIDVNLEQFREFIHTFAEQKN